MNHPFSDEYIRMAPAAAEIQAMRLDVESYILGDWFVGDHGPELYDRSTLYFGVSPAWLPLLHQLLAMLEPWTRRGNLRITMPMNPGEMQTYDPPMPGTPFERIAEAVRTYGLKGVLDPHELALMVVMLERFQKKWDGAQWVNL